MWRTFNGDLGRVRHPSPDDYKKSLVADLHDVAARYPADPDLAGMIRELRRSSAEFADLWTSSTVAHHGNERKTVDHPTVGELTLDCDVLTVHGADLRLIVFTATPGGEAADKLRLLSVLGTQQMQPPPSRTPGL